MDKQALKQYNYVPKNCNITRQVLLELDLKVKELYLTRGKLYAEYHRDENISNKKRDNKCNIILSQGSEM